MNDGMKKLIRLQMERTGAALEKNRMEVHYADCKEDVPAIVEQLLHPGDVVATGGSMSLEEAGVIELLRSGKYQFLDRAVCAPENRKQYFRDCFCADAYLCSANAITEDGTLYNVDGNSNRVAAICYGPDSVIVVAGCNKLVLDLDAAMKRVKTVAAPVNALRLQCDTYCAKTGKCASLSGVSPEMTDGCQCDGRICCSYVVTAHQREPKRIKVILVAEPLGF